MSACSRWTKSWTLARTSSRHPYIDPVVSNEMASSISPPGGNPVPDPPASLSSAALAVDLTDADLATDTFDEDLVKDALDAIDALEIDLDIDVLDADLDKDALDADFDMDALEADLVRTAVVSVLGSFDFRLSSAAAISVSSTSSIRSEP